METITKNHGFRDCGQKIYVGTLSECKRVQPHPTLTVRRRGLSGEGFKSPHLLKGEGDLGGEVPQLPKAFCPFQKVNRWFRKVVGEGFKEVTEIRTSVRIFQTQKNHNDDVFLPLFSSLGAFVALGRAASDCLRRHYLYRRARKLHRLSHPPRPTHTDFQIAEFLPRQVTRSTPARPQILFCQYPIYQGF
jgi:hypothetical protein